MKRVTRRQPEWLQDSAVQTIFDTFEKNGMIVYVVGGPVRNALMDIPAADIDFATPAHPEVVNRIFVEAGYRTEPTGIEHGTVSVIIDHVAYEVTTFRQDVETDGRRAVVAFTDDAAVDAERRDFTFNALYMDRSGVIYDPYHEENGSEWQSGVTDAAHRKLRFVGNAGKRIKEDYLRILRLYRFMAVLNCKVEDTALWACCYHRRGLADISGERIEKEVMKLLAAEDPIVAVTEMLKSEVGVFVFGSIDADIGGFARLVHSGPNDPALRLAYLLFNTGAAIHCLDKWKSSNELRRRVLDAQSSCLITQVSAGHSKGDVLAADSSDQRVRARMYQYGKEAVIDGAWLFYAASARQTGKIAEIGKPFTSEIIAHWASLDVPVFPVKGQDLLDAGMAPGRDVGVRLKEIEDRWIAENFPEREAVLAWV